MTEKKLDQRETACVAGAPTSEHEYMWAVVWHGKEDVRYEMVPRPILVDPEDVLVRVTATTICGSDLHYYTKEVKNMRKGQVIGHEAMGIVEQVGPEVRRVSVGDRVVIAFDIACGKCPHCLRKEFTGCQRTNPSKQMEGMYGHTFAGVFGFGDLGGGYSGCQSEYVRVPFGDVNLLKVPADLPDEKALFLSDIACTSYHAAVELGQVKQGDNVAIWGAGPVGILAAKWASLAGAANIFVIDEVKDRLDRVRTHISGTHPINFHEVNVHEELERLAPGGVDVSIECAGFRYAKSRTHKIERALMLETDSADILNEMVQSTRLFGRMVLIADYIGFVNHFNIGGMMEKHLYVSGGQTPVQAIWGRVLEHMQKGEFDPSVCVTHFGKLSEAPEFYKKFHHKADGVIKTFLRPEGAVRTLQV